MNTSQPWIKKYTILNLNFKESFEQLNEEEKSYLYYLTKACWAGQPIVLFQTSYESPALFIIFQTFFSSFQPFSEMKTILLKNNITDINYVRFITYAASFYSNFGNYSPFGKKKVIPELNIEEFESILKVSPSFKDISSTWDVIKYIIYDDSPNSSTINLEEHNGKNRYYIGCIKEEQIRKVDSKLKENNYSLLNTRLLMYNQSKVIVLIASVDEKQIDLDKETVLSYGEFSSFLKKTRKLLEEAKKYALNDLEKEILDDYILSISTGDIEKHKESQRKWVKDNKPIIDFNIGWIESNIDPLGVRGYYEGWAGILDKEKTQKFNQLEEMYTQLLNDLPWDMNFEKDNNNIPECSSLEVVGFASNGCPTGKHIPKYQDVQENFGTKNIFLNNAYLYYKNKGQKLLLFCNEKDIELITNFGDSASSIVEACKSLIGHGSGKIFRILSNEGENKTYNFNPDLINPLTEKKIDKFYQKNETFEERFTNIASTLEECRSQIIGLYLGFNKSIQEIFYINECDYKEVIYVMWLIHFRKGILGLHFYNENNKKWGHSATQAAWIFTNYILENQKEGEEIIKIGIDEKTETFEIIVKKELILCTGMDLISKLLIKLHIWKCTGDIEEANNFINKYSQVNEKYCYIKKILNKIEVPKKLYLYHNLIQNNEGSITIKEYPETLEGLIESNLDRFGLEFNKDVYNQWIKYATNFIKV